MVNIDYWVIWFIIILLFCIIIPRRNKFYFDIVKRKKRGERRNMPNEMMKEFIGKVCNITLFNDSFGIVGKIVSTESNWVKVLEKNTYRIINGDMIRDIKIMPEKYQKD